MIKLNFVKSKLLSKILCKQCIVCGKVFAVKVNRDGLIETDCFHSYIRKYYFMGWAYELIDIKNIDAKVVYKNNFYKIIGFCKLSREIVYFFWSLIFGWQRLEYWECTKCSKNSETK